MTEFAAFFGLEMRAFALLVVALPLWVFGGFLAIVNWLIVRYNWINHRKGTDSGPSMGPSFGLLLTLGCLLFPPTRIHATWVWLLDPSSILLFVSLPILVREIFTPR